MDIKNNTKDYEKALKQAHEEYPLILAKYKVKQIECVPHDFSFCVFCDGGDWDIVRCLKCGKEIVCKCTFDEDYD